MFQAGLNFSVPSPYPSLPLHVENSPGHIELTLTLQHVSPLVKITYVNVERVGLSVTPACLLAKYHTCVALGYLRPYTDFDKKAALRYILATALKILRFQQFFLIPIYQSHILI